MVCEGKYVCVCDRKRAMVESMHVRVGLYKMLLPFAGICFAAMDNLEATHSNEMESNETNGADEILEYAIQYAQDGSYPPNLTKDKKREQWGSVLPF